MKKKFLFVLAVCLTASLLTVTPSAIVESGDSLSVAYKPIQAYAILENLETQEPYPASTYYYSQLTAEGKLIFDAVTSEANRTLLMEGKPITVGTPFSITVPEQISNADYKVLFDAFSAEQERLHGFFPYLSDAAAAINRDRSDIFWTNGIQIATSCKIDGVPVSGGFSFERGKTYTLALEITFPLGADWDGADASDRDLSADVAHLTQAVKVLASEAKAAGDSRAEQLRYVNDKLCKYNDYNTPAAAGNYPFRYPWTALSALDQLSSEDDASGGLKPVCEGYARALKLICDELGIPCVLVGGTGNGENHLWNYVQLENGYWYAMDVTWNDSTNSDAYFLVGKDVMDEKHTTSNRIMASDQTVEFLYPVLSQSTYLPADFSLTAEANGQSLTAPLSGGGTVTVIPNGVTDPQALTLTCSDPSVTLTVNADGSRTATLPNTTATYRFDGVYLIEGTEIPASVTVSVVHVHAHGNAVPHDATQHKQVCACGDTVYTPHSFGEWDVTKEATEDETGLRERACPCGYEEEETVPKLEKKPAETDDKTDDETDEKDETTLPDSTDETAPPKSDNTNSNATQKPVNDVAYGCSLSIASAELILLCALGSLLTLRKQKK